MLFIVIVSLLKIDFVVVDSTKYSIIFGGENASILDYPWGASLLIYSIGKTYPRFVKENRQDHMFENGYTCRSL